MVSFRYIQLEISNITQLFTNNIKKYVTNVTELWYIAQIWLLIS